MALEITDATFEEVVLKSDKPVVVDFWAAWCGPCRMVGPIIEELSAEYDGKAVVGKVDVDANQQFAAKFGIRNIPTVLVFKDGEIVNRQVGVSPKKVYADAIEAVLYPAQTKHLYFVSKNDGSHHFSSTLAEHNRAVDYYQKKRGKIPPKTP